MPLTNKQVRFVEEYLVDLNGTQAAVRAGYSQTGARQRLNFTTPSVEIGNALLKINQFTKD